MKLLWVSLLAACVITIFEPMAQAQFWWTNTGSQTWEQGSNWVTDAGTGTAPSFGDNALIAPGFSFSYSGGFVTIAGGGASTININSTTSPSVSGVCISSYLVDAGGGIHSISNGILNLTFQNGGSLTTLTAGGSGFDVLGSTTVNFTGNLVVLNGGLKVGSTTGNIETFMSGPGTLNVTTGSSVNLDGGGASLFVGNGAAAPGTVSLTGATYTTGSYSYIGSNGATGTFNLSANSTLNIGDQVTPGQTSYFLYVAAGSNAQGNLNITDSTLNAAGTNPTAIYVGLLSGDKMNSLAIRPADTCPSGTLLRS